MDDVPTSSTYLHLTLKDFSTLLQVIVYILIDHAYVITPLQLIKLPLTLHGVLYMGIYMFWVQIFRIHAYANVCDNATLVERA